MQIYILVLINSQTQKTITSAEEKLKRKGGIKIDKEIGRDQGRKKEITVDHTITKKLKKNIHGKMQEKENKKNNNINRKLCIQLKSIETKFAHFQ